MTRGGMIQDDLADRSPAFSACAGDLCGSRRGELSHIGQQDASCAHLGRIMQTSFETM